METKNIIFSHFQKHRLDKFVHSLTIGQELPNHITCSPSCSHLPILLFPDKLTSITYAGAHGMTSNLLPVTWSIELQKVGVQIVCAYSSIKHKKNLNRWRSRTLYLQMKSLFILQTTKSHYIYVCAHSCIAGSIKQLLFFPCLPFGLMHHLTLWTHVMHVFSDLYCLGVHYKSSACITNRTQRRVQVFSTRPNLK